MRRVIVTVAMIVIGLTGMVVCNTYNQETPSFEDTVARTIGSVVHIKNETGGWQGSGVAITEDIILTARHVAATGQKFVIRTNDGNSVIATRAITSKKYDLGFIKIDKPVLKPAKFGGMKGRRLGEQVYAIGSPFGITNFNSVTLGIISCLSRDLEKHDCPKDYGWSVVFQTDAAGHPGNSGCPVFTLDGVVRGILVGGFSNALIYCVPVDLAATDIEIIELLFSQDKYQFEDEVTPDPVESYTSKGGVND
jgi:S1-C subfamily serine protease